LKALDTYHKINDDVNNEVLILAHLATKFLLIAQPDSALNYYYKAYELAEKNHLVKTQNEMCMGLASTYCYISDNEKALDYARRGIITADSTVLVTSLVTLAQCYFDCDSLDKAKDILRAIPCQSDDYINKYLIFRNLSEIAILQQDYDSISAYVDSAYECLENRFFHVQGVKDEYYQANLIKELEKEQIQHEAERNVWILVFSIVLLVLLALFIYNVLKNKIAVERHKRLNHLLSQRVEHTKHLQEQQEKEHVIMENEKEIQHQRDIIRQKAMTLSILQKLLLEKLHHMSQTLSEAEKIQMTRETWTEMEQLLNATDNGFVARLRQQHKDFKEEDIHLCMLIRLKMNNTVVSNIYNIGVDAVKKRKLNLKKNGFKVSDSSIRLEDVIDNL
jgi:tetratricopeptide (TPR) repeat protein